jgi:hypothetical protein
MKHGHVYGTRKERTPRQATIDRYRAMGEAIARKLAATPPGKLRNFKAK